MNFTNTLTRSVTDVMMNTKYQCKFDECTYTVRDRHTARKHVQDHEADPDIYLSEVKMQKVFNSYLHKYCVMKTESMKFDMKTETRRMLAAFKQQVKELLLKASPIDKFLLTIYESDLSVCAARLAIVQRIHRMITMRSTDE